MARMADLHKKWLKEPKYKKAYDALEEEFVLASTVMNVRNRAGVTQQALARKMRTTQPVIARLESGRTPSRNNRAGPSLHEPVRGQIASLSRRTYD